MQEGKSSRVFLLSAIILGVLATLISLLYLGNAEKERYKTGIKVLVAKKDFRDGAQIDPDKDLAEMELEAIKDRLLTPDAKSAYKGQCVNHMVLAGTPILLADLVAMPRIEPQKGYVALAIPLKKGNSILVAGDLVKLMVTKPAPKKVSMAPAAPAPVVGGGDPSAAASAGPSPSMWETRLVLSRPVKVLFCGARRSQIRDTVSMKYARSSVSEMDADPSVIVEVKEDEAQIILEQTGQWQLPLQLLLCAPETDAPKAP